MMFTKPKWSKPMIEKTWTPSRVLILSAEWAKGIPAREIAATLNGTDVNLSLTKNSVVGKANRLGLGPHPGAHPSPAAPSRSVRTPPATTTPAVKADAVRAAGLCQWPSGDVPHMTFCHGAVSADDWAGVYCAEHVARAYRPRTEDGKKWVREA